MDYHCSYSDESESAALMKVKIKVIALKVIALKVKVKPKGVVNVIVMTGMQSVYYLTVMLLP